MAGQHGLLRACQTSRHVRSPCLSLPTQFPDHLQEINRRVQGWTWYGACVPLDMHMRASSVSVQVQRAEPERVRNLTGGDGERQESGEEEGCPR